MKILNVHFVRMDFNPRIMYVVVRMNFTWLKLKNVVVFYSMKIVKALMMKDALNVIQEQFLYGMINYNTMIVKNMNLKVFKIV